MTELKEGELNEFLAGMKMNSEFQRELSKIIDNKEKEINSYKETIKSIVTISHEQDIEIQRLKESIRIYDGAYGSSIINEATLLSQDTSKADNA